MDFSKIWLSRDSHFLNSFGADEVDDPLVSPEEEGAALGKVVRAGPLVPGSPPSLEAARVLLPELVLRAFGELSASGRLDSLSMFFETTASDHARLSARACS